MAGVLLMQFGKLTTTAVFVLRHHIYMALFPGSIITQQYCATANRDPFDVSRFICMDKTIPRSCSPYYSVWKLQVVVGVVLVVLLTCWVVFRIVSSYLRSVVDGDEVNVPDLVTDLNVVAYNVGVQAEYLAFAYNKAISTGWTQNDMNSIRRGLQSLMSSKHVPEVQIANQVTRIFAVLPDLIARANEVQKIYANRYVFSGLNIAHNFAVNGVATGGYGRRSMPAS